MINKKQTFIFGDVSFAVDPKKPYITMSLGKEKRSIKKNELWTMVFAISKDKKQADLIPVVQKEMVEFVKQVKFRASRDIKKGEFVEFHIPVNIPLTIVQAQLSKEEKQEILEARDIPSPFVRNPSKGV